jgi:hypothetical protein
MRGTANADDMTWLDHLSDGDLKLLARVAEAEGLDADALGHRPEAVEPILALRATFDALFGGAGCGGGGGGGGGGGAGGGWGAIGGLGGDVMLAGTTPFLTFAVVVHRGWSDLQTVRYVEEWVGARQRIPVLGGGDLRGFLARSERRLFLSELLASYTHLASGATWVHTRRGWRKRRFSELDPIQLASLLDVVPDGERAGVYRRLGDLALFLTGVFPDHTETRGLGLVGEQRLLRLSGVRIDDPRPDGLPDPGTGGPVSLLERLGVRWYRLAAATAAATTLALVPSDQALAEVTDIADHFSQARRTLNFLTDRYLFQRRVDWFGNPAA